MAGYLVDDARQLGETHTLVANDPIPAQLTSPVDPHRYARVDGARSYELATRRTWMIEVLVMIGVVGALGVRARQRRLGRGVVMGVAGIGWVVLFLLGSAVLGPISLILRWAWLGGVYLYVENAHKGKKAADSWQCPDCRMFNDPGTLVCLCGYENPETA